MTPAPSRYVKISAWWQKNRTIAIPLLLAVLVKLFSLHTGWVERYYTNGLYPVLARIQRILLGWVPFSLGDLLYALIAGWLVYKTVRFIKRLVKRRFHRQYVLLQLKTYVILFAWVYVAFNLLWGLNYNRRGIAWQLDLDVKPYSNTDLVAVITVLKERLNQTADTNGTMQAMARKKVLFSKTMEAYDSAAHQYPFLHMHTRSVKPSIFSHLVNYLGFLGYYNPFSGEAQVNTTVPLFLQPNIACHEMAHQAGYAKENEANFVGYLAAKNSPDPRFRYSTYFDLLEYAALELRLRDSALARTTLQGLHPQVKRDEQELWRFRRSHRNPFEQLTMWIYGYYLRANSMPNGVATYNEVIAWLIAYHKKMGSEAL